MKKLTVFLFALTIVLSFATTVSAEEQGRPDPTGKGRYMQFGHENENENAHVATELPVGVECAPAGELVGVKVWNSTRTGKAILSELTDKALVAVTSDGQIFLCECAGGYNQLFLINSTPPPTSVSTQVVNPPQVVVNVTQTQSQVVESPIKGLDYLEKEQLPPIFDANVPVHNERRPSRIYKYRYRIIGGAAVVGGIAAWTKYLCLW